MTIEEFIEARLAEREVAANEAIELEAFFDPDEFATEYQWLRITKRRESRGAVGSQFVPGAPTPREVLRQCAAHRTLIASYLEGEAREAARQAGLAARGLMTDGMDGDSEYAAGRSNGLRSALAALAAIWPDHPDYDQEWRVPA